jgi:biotin synthase
VPIWDTVRVIAVARLLMPTSVVRLSAGRHLMGFSDQALCFLVGASSIFSSERNFMLTSAVPCNDHDSDREMLRTMGLRPKALETPVEVAGDRSSAPAAPTPAETPAGVR